jgi:hypothetical protein
MGERYLVPTQIVRLSAAKKASCALRSTKVWDTMLLSMQRMTVTVLLVTLRDTIYLPSREKPKPWELTDRTY